MSKSFRPVVETWGTSSSCFLEIETLERVLLDLAEFSDPDSATLVNDYDENRVVWIENGTAFINFISANSVSSLLSSNSDWEESREGDNLLSVFKNMKSLCDDWRKMLDPTDGSLTFYIDQY